MARHVVCSAATLDPGDHRTVKVDGRAIGIYNVEGRHYAIRDICPHQGAPLCVGAPRGTMLDSEVHEYEYGLEGKIVRCPWHGFEFNLETGSCVAAPDRYRVKTYRVEVEGDDLVLYT